MSTFLISILRPSIASRQHVNCVLNSSSPITTIIIEAMYPTANVLMSLSVFPKSRIRQGKLTFIRLSCLIHLRSTGIIDGHCYSKGVSTGNLFPVNKRLRLLSAQSPNKLDNIISIENTTSQIHI